MSAVALRPSTPPDAPPLRAKSLGKLRHPGRLAARTLGVAATYRASRHLSDSRLGAELGGANDGAQVRTGALVLTTHEAALLLPLDVAHELLADALRERVVRELSKDELNANDELRLRLVLTHLDALAALRPGRP